ncbi:hypothetical protein C8034_v011478 [Colletotrichum sidae]|uniref:Uncharacterized protein n=1 Tax=Colletotrichum sidae TaxID=1347389 RepID=A0A4R8TJ27_9PEZI|nr:hypothetical protein C8034_v011478 [Colletotrichum sidae]
MVPPILMLPGPGMGLFGGMGAGGGRGGGGGGGGRGGGDPVMESKSRTKSRPTRRFTEKPEADGEGEAFAGIQRLRTSDGAEY